MSNPLTCPAHEVVAILDGRQDPAERLPPKRWCAFYWFRFDGLPVLMPALRTKRFLWTRIHGVQIGPWFFGAIKGGPSLPAVEAAPEGVSGETGEAEPLTMLRAAVEQEVSR